MTTTTTAPLTSSSLTPPAHTTDFEPHVKAGRILPGMSFNQRVWAMTARIPAGRVVTYADLAHALGTRAYRAIGNAMNKNPYAPAVPCHRVVGSTGALTGYAGGLPKKRQMLLDEGVTLANDRVVITDRFRFTHAGPTYRASGS